MITLEDIKQADHGKLIEISKTLDDFYKVEFKRRWWSAWDIMNAKIQRGDLDTKEWFDDCTRKILWDCIKGV